MYEGICHTNTNITLRKITYALDELSGPQQGLRQELHVDLHIVVESIKIHGQSNVYTKKLPHNRRTRFIMLIVNYQEFWKKGGSGCDYFDINNTQLLNEYFQVR